MHQVPAINPLNTLAVLSEGLVDDLVNGVFTPRRIPLRCTHPRDLIDQALSLADYLSQPRQLTSTLLREASATYFVDESQPGSPAH